MNKEYKRDLLRKFSPHTEINKLSDEEVDKLYKVWKENFLAWSREFTSSPTVVFSTAKPAYYKSSYQREMELISGLPRIPHNNERIHYPKVPEVQKMLEDMSNMCCNCRRKLNRELSDENDAFDSIVLGLYLSPRTRPKPEPLTEEQLEKFSEQMDEMSEKCGKRPIEEVRGMYRGHIRRSLIGLNNLYNNGVLSDSDYQQAKERLKKVADEYNVDNFENLPYIEETQDLIQKENEEKTERLAEILNDCLEKHGFARPSSASPSPTPPVYVLESKPEFPAMIDCSFKDGKASRRERRAKERMMKKQNKRY
mgnify:CR=1 FL=1|jgi:hypothetical protein|nr:MAG TPA: hypothetical protein [Caudoviricetes sp.]